MGRAYRDECLRRGYQSEIYDLYTGLPKESKFYDGGYLFLVKYLPKPYEFVWERLRKRPNKPSRSFYRSIKKALPLVEKKINEYKPDAIMCMHISCGGIVGLLRKEKRIDPSIKYISVGFDYVLCPYWEHCADADYVITPGEICHDEFVSKGFDRDKLVCLGFPVNYRFQEQRDKTQTRKALGIKDKFTVITIAGGAGIGSTYGIVKSIADKDGEIQILAVCGRNAKEKARIDKYIADKNMTNVITYGFTDKIPELMAASDIAFARGGGNGISECFYSGLPVVFRNGLIINERENAELFTAEGMGDMIKKPREAGEKAAYYKAHPEILNSMRQKINAFIKVSPTEKTIDFVTELVQGGK